MRNDYIFSRLEPIIKDMFDFCDITFTKVDASIHIEDGWPIGTDLFIICGFLKSKLYVHRMYIVKEANDLVIDRQVVKLIERIRNDVFERSQPEYQ